MVNVAGYAASLAIVFLVNIVAGYWRAHAKQRGNRLEWALAVHAPVPLVVLLRRALGISLSAGDAGLVAGMVAAYFLGQRLGGVVYGSLRARGVEPGRFLLRDLARLRRVG